MKAAMAFIGVVDGKQKAFAVGDKITAKEAEELGLESKPHLIQKAKAVKS